MRKTEEADTQPQVNQSRESRGRAIKWWPPVSITASPLTPGAKQTKKK